MAYTTIDDPSAYFQTTLYTGNRSSSQTITNDGNSDLKPDWLWIKPRNDTVLHSHSLFDSTRGVTKGLASNLNEAEYTTSSKVTSFNTDGFSIGNGASVNQPDRDVNYVTWQWKANGGTTSSNTDGSITSTVQANTNAGFSIATWTCPSSPSTYEVGHGLGAVPDLMIVRGINQATNWHVYHKDTGSGGATFLNLTNAFTSNSAYFGGINPTSSVFSTNVGAITDAGYNVLGYFFKSIEGYSKFGSYTGNGSTDGTFVYTGFRPAWLLVKDSSAGENWMMYDNKRDPFNEVDANLKANASQAETDYDVMDFVSNGFKIRQSSGDTNNNGNKYIYMAFAKNPFVTSGAVPVTAR